MPVGGAGSLEVVDLHREVGAAADGQRFFEAGEDLLPFGTHVGDVDAMVAAYDFTDLDEFFGVGVGVGG